MANMFPHSRRGSNASSVSGESEMVPADVAPSAAYRSQSPVPMIIVDQSPIHESPKHHTAELPSVHVKRGESASGLFQESVLKIIEARQSSGDTLVEPFVERIPGAEPGVDPRRASAQRAYGHIHENCEIEVVDFNKEKSKFRQFNNESFINFLNSTESKRTNTSTVRWINVGGISWDVLSALTLKYSLHPLSLEDVLHSRSTTRSKADYYQRHLFIHVLCHALSSKKASPLRASYMEENSDDDVSEAEDSDLENYDDDEADNRDTLLRKVTIRGRRRRPTLAPDPEKNVEKPAPMFNWRETAALLSPEGRRRAARAAQLEALKKGIRLRVIINNAFFFLFKDGTLLSLHQGDRSFGNPIYERLRHQDSILRQEPDASLLLEALLDLIVDQALQVVEKYGDKISESETNVLLNPSMKTVQQLHILSADLTLRKRTMQPIKSLIYGLRRYDVDRCAAVWGTSPLKTEGYMSLKSKTYLADVGDHLEHILASLDMYSQMTENLIDFSFNMNSHAANEVMRRMTLLMCVFLPLTLLTGYFGMNFEPFPAVNSNSDVLFWKIAVPTMAVIIPLFLWGDIVRMVRYFSKMKLINTVEKKQIARAKTVNKAELRRRRTLKGKEA